MSNVFCFLDNDNQFVSRLIDFSSAVRRHHPQAAVSVWSPARPPDEKGSFRRLMVPWLRDLPKPCGVFAVCDRVAVNVLSAAVSLGLSVPDDLPRRCGRSRADLPPEGQVTSRVTNAGRDRRAS